MHLYLGILVYNFFVCVMFLLWLWYQSGVGHTEWIRKCSLLLHYLEEFNRSSFFFKYLVYFTNEAIWCWTFLCQEFSYYWFNLFTFIGLLKFSTLSWVSLGNLCASRIRLCHLGYLLFWHRAIHSIALKSFCFLMTGSNVSTFISDVFCSFLSVSLAKGLSILLLFQGINLVSSLLFFCYNF